MKKGLGLLSILAVTTSVLAVSTAYAQQSDASSTAAPAPAPDSATEVVVIGIRGALENAEIKKKRSEVVVDGFSADDMGQLPDVSISESLMRITGVTSNDTARGSDQVAIRGLGPDMAATEFNGRILPTSDGITRRVGLAGLPTEGLSGAYAQKTPDAATIEGGVAGILQLESVRPLTSRKQGLNLVARAITDDLSRDFDGVDGARSVGGRGEISYIKKFSPDFGVSFSFSDLKQSNVLSGVQLENWQLGTTTRADLNGDGNPDALPANAGPINLTFTTERPSFMGMVQWNLNDAVRMSFDALASQDRYDNRTRRYFALNPFSGALGAANSSTVVNDTATAFDGTVALYRGVIGDSKVRDKTTQFGLNFDIHPGGNLSGNVDMYWANAGRDRYSPSVNFDVAGATAAAQWQDFSYDLNGHTGATFTFTPLAADQYAVQQATTVKQDSDDTVKAIRADLTYTGLPVSFIRDIKFGGRLESRVHGQTVNNTQYTFATLTSRPALDASYLLSDANPLAKNAELFGGQSAVTFPYYDMFKVLDYALNAPNVVVNDQFSADIGATGTVEEHTSALYVQADISAGRLTGNTGLRWVQTESIVTGQAGTNPSNVVDREFSSTHHWLLPSLNLRYELMNDLFLRFGASRTISRPQFGDMTVGAAVDLSGATSGLITITQGNPSLQPYTADSIDIGLEWYPDSSTFASIAYYDKQVKNFVTAHTTQTTITLDDGTVAPAEITENINDPTAHYFRGFEVQVRKNLDFLPGMLSGLGVLVNYNHNATDERETFTSLVGETVEVLPINFSKDSVNAQIFYDHGPLDLRLAYRFASGYSRQFAKGYQYQPNGYLDFNFTYRLNASTTVMGTFTNIAGAGIYRTTADYRDLGNPYLVQNISAQSRTITLGLRKHF